MQKRLYIYVHSGVGQTFVLVRRLETQKVWLWNLGAGRENVHCSFAYLLDERTGDIPTQQFGRPAHGHSDRHDDEDNGHGLGRLQRKSQSQASGADGQRRHTAGWTGMPTTSDVAMDATDSQPLKPCTWSVQYHFNETHRVGHSSSCLSWFGRMLSCLISTRHLCVLCGAGFPSYDF